MKWRAIYQIIGTKKTIAETAKTQRLYEQVFELLTPRDREGSFGPQIVKKRQTSLHSELETKILSMFASGMGYRDIMSHVEEIYDNKVSVAEISSITDKLLPVINEWRSHPLQSNSFYGSLK